jgi:hypothetical protein
LYNSAKPRASGDDALYTARHAAQRRNGIAPTLQQALVRSPMHTGHLLFSVDSIGRQFD